MPATLEPSCYPLARKDPAVVDNFHGIKVADPYRWMEDPDSEETKKFVDDINSVSAPFLKGAPNRENMLRSVLYQQNNITEKGKVFLDPNSLNAEGTTSLRISAFSKDGSIFAYGLSEKGSDWVTVKFKTAEGKDLDDKITGVKHSTLCWTKDNLGVFYSKYPDHKGDTEGTSTVKHEYHSLYYHKLGTECSADILVYERRDDPNYMIGGFVTDDGRLLTIDVSRGCDPYNMLYYYDLTANPITERINPAPLFDKLDAKYDYIDHDENSMLLQTNKDAPMFRLIRVSLKNPDQIVEVIAEQSRNKLDWVAPIPGSRLLVAYLEDVKSTLYVYTTAGEKLYQIPIPIGTISGVFAKKTINEELRRVNLPGIDESQFKVEQVFFESKDKTKVPMFIISNANLTKNSNNPTILNGYGGFNIADTPCFSISRLLFIKHLNGVIACANLRGGSEYGEAWHIAGMKENKQNVFDDMQAAADFLIKEKYTSTPKLAIQGGSNGGLLMGACSQQRPDLFGAVVNRVGVLDMLRFHKFTIGGAWVPEYGNPDDPKDFAYIYKYSPLHNIKMPSEVTADHDDRVVPSHTLKYTATLYEAVKNHPGQKNPILARIEVKAGHGAGKPTTKVIEECVDIYSFLQRVLDLTWKD